MNRDILKECTIHSIDMDRLKELNNALYKRLAEDSGFDKEESYLAISESELYPYDLPPEVLDGQYFDKDQLREELTELIGKHDHYLVFAEGCRWNGASGYKICDDICDTVYRDYEINLMVNGNLSDKAIRCTEYSHDVPMGGTTYIIGLTDKEYEDLEDSNFDEVRRFVEGIEEEFTQEEEKEM